jgi:hypothetical protein
MLNELWKNEYNEFILFHCYRLTTISNHLTIMLH